MKKFSLFSSLLLLGSISAQAFCGFYVAKADGKLFNKSSQVIISRNDKTNKSTITMSNDFQGDFKEFAMVVPVPVVLKKKDIKVMNSSLFTRFDGYSAPRLAEYYDRNPCYSMVTVCDEAVMLSGVANKSMIRSFGEKEKYRGVKIEAKYEVGEYDILVLSAKESNGLKNWLTDNGYKIPAKAEEVLNPYIKDKMKFFVAKVNVDRMKITGKKELSPIQISFTHAKFMLPIRLGMANANGFQDLIVYLFTQNGRVETSNYQTKEMPSNEKVPLFIKDHFGNFYKSLFSKHWTNNKSNVFLEYSWDLNGSNFTKCDPCSTTPPSSQELVNAGVDWLSFNGNRWGSQYNGNLHFTRLHIRYDREHFPQDLMFSETKNKQNYQSRFVLTHPANINEANLQTSPKDPSQPIIYGGCDINTVVNYYQSVQDRREEEIKNLGKLTWWEMDRYQAYLDKYQNKINKLQPKNQERKKKENSFFPVFPGGKTPPMIFAFVVGLILMSSSLLIMRKSLKYN